MMRLDRFAPVEKVSFPPCVAGEETSNGPALTGVDLIKPDRQQLGRSVDTKPAAGHPQ